MHQPYNKPITEKLVTGSSSIPQSDRAPPRYHPPDHRREAHPGTFFHPCRPWHSLGTAVQSLVAMCFPPDLVIRVFHGGWHLGPNERSSYESKRGSCRGQIQRDQISCAPRRSPECAGHCLLPGVLTAVATSLRTHQ